MATGGKEAPCSPENLICPLCLDVFDDATLLSCRHTFCRKCLKRYDASHQDRDYMVCPLCRSDTKLQENRVDGFPANATVNGLVDDYHGITGGLYAALEVTPVCTVCNVQADAISYCAECRHYMCEICHQGHQRMTSFFDNHKTVSMSEVGSGKFNIHQHPERCPIHRQESRDMFCVECKIYICFKCVIVAHRDHKIKNQPDFERELRLKVDSLLERCKARKRELEKNIQNTEARRQDVHVAVQKLETEVREAYDKKARQLKENERLLLENLQSLKMSFDDDLDALKAKDRQKIKSIVSSVSLVDNDRLGCLEADSLAAHCLLCDDLEQILKDVKDDTSAGVISKTAREKVFKPADESLLHLGDIQKHLEMQLSRTVDLPGCMSGIAALSEDAAIIGYCDACDVEGADKVDSNGNISQHFPKEGYFYDLAYQSQTRNTVVSWTSTHVRIYSSPDSTYYEKNLYNCNLYPRISSNDKYEIVIANRRSNILIYDPAVSTMLFNITTKDPPHQAFETRSGAIIASTCDQTNPGKVTVYDRRGRAGDILTAEPGEHLYAAVDSQDRVYVASVNRDAGKVAITQYTMDGLNLKEVFQFEELELSLDNSWCYMVSLSCDLLAFACGKKLYFIEIKQ